MSGKKILKTLSDNSVLIAGTCLVVGIHWGWWMLQQNPNLVDPQHRSELPIYVVSLVL